MGPKGGYVIYPQPSASSCCLSCPCLFSQGSRGLDHSLHRYDPGVAIVLGGRFARERPRIGWEQGGCSDRLSAL